MPRVHSARNRDEFEVILIALEEKNGVKARWLAELSVLWTLRFSDLLAITTSQIDESFNTGELYIIKKRTKSKKNQIIKLTAYDIKILNKIRASFPKDKYLFESHFTRKRQPLYLQTVLQWLDRVGIDVKEWQNEIDRLSNTGSETDSLLNHIRLEKTVNDINNNKRCLVNTISVGEKALFI